MADPDLDTTVGARRLREVGYRFCAGVRTIEADYDDQGHVNNAAVARWLNNQRVRYAQAVLEPTWTDHLRDSGRLVVARELHVSYDTEGLPGERFVCGTRVAGRRRKAGIVEQYAVERDTGRDLARAWLVQLLVERGEVVAWPDWYWELVSGWEGRPFPDEGSHPRASWGPPPALG